MEVSLRTVTGEKGGVINISEEVFAAKFNEPLIHQVVVAYLAGGRSGTRAQKKRSQVSGGGSKPWRQKGTGRARAGSIRSPLWRGGGVTFAAVPRSHKQKLNKKMYRGALRSTLSELVRQERLIIVEHIQIELPKTSLLLKKLEQLKLDNVLIILDEMDKNLYFAARNLLRVDVKLASSVDIVSLIKYEKVLMTIAAIKKIEERFSLVD